MDGWTNVDWAFYIVMGSFIVSLTVAFIVAVLVPFLQELA